MEKYYAIDVDFRVTKRIYVNAETADDAEKKVKDRLTDNPYTDAMNPDSVTDFDIIEVSECFDDLGTAELREAICYVREQLGADRLAVIRSQANVCYEQRRPIDTDYNDEVYDLLEEYGDDNDLCEEWWSESIELEDIIVRL